MMTTFTKFYCFCFSFLRLQVYANTCEIETFDEKWRYRENEFANIFYLLNITDSSNYSEKFNIIFDVCEGNKLATLCNFIWRKQSNKMSVTNWRAGKDTICSAKHLNSSRHVVAFDIHIAQLFRRPLTLLKLSITDSKESLEVLRLIALEVSYPPKVTNLTVSSHELGSDYVINEGEKVTLICSFEKGYPPSHFRLVDKLGQELHSTREEETISHSFSVECEDDWPITRCEGEGSEVNRSVSFLVRCPPQFLDMYPKIIRHSSEENWIFNIKAYTTAIEKCLLTTGSSGQMSSKEVNCTLHGDLPHLVLTVRLDKEGQSQRKHWTLTLRHEKGYSSKISGSDIEEHVVCLCGMRILVSRIKVKRMGRVITDVLMTGEAGISTLCQTSSFSLLNLPVCGKKSLKLRVMRVPSKDLQGVLAKVRPQHTRGLVDISSEMVTAWRTKRSGEETGLLVENCGSPALQTDVTQSVPRGNLNRGPLTAVVTNVNKCRA